MSTVVLIGVQDDKLANLLEKMGNQVFIIDGEQEVKDVFVREIVDCVYLTEKKNGTIKKYFELFSSIERIKDIPIIVTSEAPVPKIAGCEVFEKNINYIEEPCALGFVVTRMATLLRLRKLAGKNEDTASLAEVNAHLRDLNNHFEENLREAAKIQQNLVPKSLPNSDPRFSIASMYVPLEDVGGDWYYVSTRSDGKYSMYIADVTGHGLPAALIASMTKMAMTAAGEQEPNEVLTVMNRLMSPNIPEGRFITIFAALYDAETGELTYSRGGHPVGLLFSKQANEVKELSEGGFAIGFLPDSTYELGRTKLEVGDTLLLYTDALVESQSLSGEMYGEKRLSESLLKTANENNATKILKSIESEFNAFRKERIIKDDVTVIVLKRLQ